MLWKDDEISDFDIEGLHDKVHDIIKDNQERLYKCFDEVIWMAIRYAHGRQTYAPGVIREAVTEFKKVFPDWKPKEDITITPPEGDFRGFRSDYLDDLFNERP